MIEVFDQRDQRRRSEGQGAAAPEISPDMQRALGATLQKYCDELIRQPVPDRLLALLAQLEAKERGAQ